MSTTASSASASGSPAPARRGEPVWELAYLFPLQGEWTEAEYLALDTNRIVELSDGCLDVHLDADDPQSPAPSQPGEPAWEVALLFPSQGDWSEEEYLALTRRSNRLIELTDGCLEFLPMPTPFHQRMVRFLFKLLEAYVLARGLGEVFFSPLPIRLWASKFRDPDIVFLYPARLRDPYHQPQGADLAVEIVSPGETSRERDLVTKRAEYARAGIAEYWIVDPEQQRITVLTLDGAAYREHGSFAPGQRASSVLLQGFEVAVAEVFAAGQGVQ
jgi:Uma2 family endonuclease